MVTKKQILNCQHVWEHTTEEAENMRGDLCLWLFHKCKKCGAEAGNASKILVLKEKEAKT